MPVAIMVAMAMRDFTLAPSVLRAHLLYTSQAKGSTEEGTAPPTEVAPMPLIQEVPG